MAIILPYYIGEGDTTSNTKIQSDLQEIANNIEYDDLIYKITSVGDIDYVGFARIGSAESDPVWQCEKVLADATITWAGGTEDFVHVATDLTALSYS